MLRKGIINKEIYIKKKKKKKKNKENLLSLLYPKYIPTLLSFSFMPPLLQVGLDLQGGGYPNTR